MGPGRIEVHVNREGTGPPDGKRGEQSPVFRDILPRQAKGKQQSKESIESGGKSHGDSVGIGKTVSRDGGSQRASQEDAAVGQQEKGSPENGGTNREMIVEMTGAGTEFGPGLAIFIDARAAKALVRMAVIFREIEIALNERSANESVIADAVAAHPGIQERKRADKEQQQDAPGFSRAWGG